MEQAFGLEGLGHANDGAHLMAGRVIGGCGRAGDENYGNAGEAFVALHDEAQVMAAHVGAFDFRDEDGRNRGAQNVESLLGGGNDDDGVAIVRKNGAHDFGGFGIGFDAEDDGLRG